VKKNLFVLIKVGAAFLFILVKTAVVHRS